MAVDKVCSVRMGGVRVLSGESGEGGEGGGSGEGMGVEVWRLTGACILSGKKRERGRRVGRGKKMSVLVSHGNDRLSQDGGGSSRPDVARGCSIWQRTSEQPTTDVLNALWSDL